MNYAGGELYLGNSITAKSVTLKGAKDSVLKLNEENTFDSITGFTTISIEDSDVKITKALTTDVLKNYDTPVKHITVGNGAALTINKGISDEYGSMLIALEKGAKPIVIGKDFDIENSHTIKLVKADETDNFDGDQIFTLPTMWKDEQVNAFFAKVDISGITSGGDSYETKFYNNKGKVTLEAYKISVFSDMEQSKPIGDGTYAFWADAVKAIDASSADMAVISIAGDLTLEKNGYAVQASYDNNQR